MSHAGPIPERLTPATKTANVATLMSIPGVASLALPVEFLLFALSLLGIAIWHRHSLLVAVAGLLSVVAYKLSHGGFAAVPGLPGLWQHLARERVILLNLLALLTGFALLARHFEASHLPQLLPDWLPDDWTGGLMLLALVFVLSAFLDNIAAAIIGGSVARVVFRGRVQIGYLAALVAAANSGGAGSVVGDTTTTMMWLSGISPVTVSRAYVAAFSALLVFGVLAARQQQRYAPIEKDAPPQIHLDKTRLLIVVVILIAAIATNVAVNILSPRLADRWPCIGLAVWAAILFTAMVRRPDWSVLPGSLYGAVFLLSLVLMASMMPVSSLPAPSLASSFLLGVVSAVFDNIPLTKLALEQGGYDWGLLAYAVGFGGSMMWFGSSAGVALCNQFPQARDAGAWLRHGWPVVLAYGVGFVVYVLVV
jgi:Na+/H+ antiporter NhaD/arsenite permease-like protein